MIWEYTHYVYVENKIVSEEDQRYGTIFNLTTILMGRDFRTEHRVAEN